jgi:hypothetical protein
MYPAIWCFLIMEWLQTTLHELATIAFKSAWMQLTMSYLG